MIVKLHEAFNEFEGELKTSRTNSNFRVYVTVTIQLFLCIIPHKSHEDAREDFIG